MPLFSFIVRRVLQMIPTVVFILVVTFVLIRLLPGDPASAMLGDRASGRGGTHGADMAVAGGHRGAGRGR